MKYFHPDETLFRIKKNFAACFSFTIFNRIEGLICLITSKSVTAGVVDFDSSKITAAIAKAGKATGEFSEKEAKKMTLRVLTLAHEMNLSECPGS